MPTQGFGESHQIHARAGIRPGKTVWSEKRDARFAWYSVAFAIGPAREVVRMAPRMGVQVANKAPTRCFNSGQRCASWASANAESRKSSPK